MGIEKYYVPGIEEFHVGFEFEIKDMSVNDGWLKMSHDYLTVDPLYICFEKNSEGEIIKEYVNDAVRVKYLDASDIEECGFEIISETKLKSYDLLCGDTHFIRTLLKRTYVDKDVIITMYDRQRVVIRLNNTRNMRAYDKHQTFDLFVGVIKNKSELKRLMKQLGIWE